MACVQAVIQEPTEWQHIGDQIDAALIFARYDFVKVNGMHSWLLAAAG